MPFADSKSQQLRVRISGEERELLDRLLRERQRGETISDLVREAIALLLRDAAGTAPGPALSARSRAQIDRLAELLQREPQQVEEACVQGILDLVEGKCDVPLIVMETHLHMKYRSRGGEEEPMRKLA